MGGNAVDCVKYGVLSVVLLVMLILSGVKLMCCML